MPPLQKQAGYSVLMGGIDLKKNDSFDEFIFSKSWESLSISESKFSLLLYLDDDLLDFWCLI